jgi:glycosyltransferase involved in cell wall biosynthesis
VFQRDSFSSKKPESDWRMLRFWATLYASDAVIAGNAYLAERAGSLVEAERVTVIPTCIDPSRYRPARHERTGGEVRLVWIGQRSTLNSMAFLQEHLAAAAARLPGLQLRVICDSLPRLEGIRVVGRPWSSETEAVELADADIGITWLPDDAWSRGKCGLRPLQFMSAGLPVVANPVGMNAEMVLSGQNGFLAGTPQEWADAIVRLASDPAQRQRMGCEGRKLVEERYQARRWGQEFAAVVAQASWQAKQGHERGRPQAGRAFT